MAATFGQYVNVTVMKSFRGETVKFQGQEIANDEYNLVLMRRYIRLYLHLAVMGGLVV